MPVARWTTEKSATVQSRHHWHWRITLGKIVRTFCIFPKILSFFPSKWAHFCPFWEKNGKLWEIYKGILKLSHDFSQCRYRALLHMEKPHQNLIKSAKKCSFFIGIFTCLEPGLKNRRSDASILASRGIRSTIIPLWDSSIALHGKIMTGVLNWGKGILLAEPTQTQGWMVKSVLEKNDICFKWIYIYRHTSYLIYHNSMKAVKDQARYTGKNREIFFIILFSQKFPHFFLKMGDLICPFWEKQNWEKIGKISGKIFSHDFSQCMDLIQEGRYFFA